MYSISVGPKPIIFGLPEAQWPSTIDDTHKFYIVLHLTGNFYYLHKEQI